MIKNVLKASPSYIIPAALSLLALTVYTRTLNVTQFALYTLAIVSIELFQAVFYTWIKMFLIRFYHQKEYDKNSILTTTLLINIAVTIILVILSTTYIYIIKENKYYIFCITANIALKGWGYYFQEYYRIAYNSLNKYTLYSLIFGILSILPGIIVVLIKKNSDVSIILFTNACFLALFNFANILILYKKIISGVLKKALIKETFIYGIPLIFGIIATSIGARVDRYIIEHTCGLNELAYYAASFSLSNMLISSLVTLLLIPSYPQIIKFIGESNNNEARKIYKKNGELILIFCLPLIVFGIEESNNICTLIIGHTMAEKTALILPYVLVATFFLNITQHFIYQMFQFSRKTSYQLYITVPIGIIHFTLGWYLSEHIGSKGMSIAGITAYIVAIVACLSLKRIEFKPEIDIMTLLKIIFSISVSFLIINNNVFDCNIIITEILLKSVFFFIGYITLMLILNGFEFKKIIIER